MNVTVLARKAETRDPSAQARLLLRGLADWCPFVRGGVETPATEWMFFFVRHRHRSGEVTLTCFSLEAACRIYEDRCVEHASSSMWHRRLHLVSASGPLEKVCRRAVWRGSTTQECLQAYVSALNHPDFLS
mmetsp:Transcript_10002/g.28036  ORF Transcript_10002/g.28036 Transcript_10002/m.28036 type:complete len:131 (-) Transcript_10002:138-530(-)